MTHAPERRSRGLVYILAATVVAGAIGYVIQLLAPAMLPDADAYLAFSVFWSALFLFVGSIAGVQQEVTRATHVADTASATSTLRTFTLLTVSVLVAASIIVGVTLAPHAFAADPWGMTLWFGIGLIGYLFIAVAAGVMYGLSLWLYIAGLTAADALFRGIFVTIALVTGAPSSVVAASIALPFGLAFGLVWLLGRERIIGRFQIDVGLRRLSLNSLGTVAAAAATGVMVTGLPLLLRLTVSGASSVELASLILIITITRAPLIVPLMALQSFLIIDFRAAGRAVWPRLVRYAVVLIGVTGLAAIVAWMWGPQVITAVSEGRYRVDSMVAMSVVLSAGLVALLCLTGPALLSENRHVPYLIGWLAAASATVVLLLIPADPVSRVEIALLAAPALGVLIHLLAIRPRVDERPAEGPGSPQPI